MTGEPTATEEWADLLREVVSPQGDDETIVQVVAAEMPLELASFATAELLAERHARLAAFYGAFAAGTASV